VAELIEAQPDATDPIVALESRQELQRVLRVLQSLSYEQRLVFVLRAVYGHSIEEIATMTGAARSTTRLRLYYGRKKFFRAMEAQLRRRVGSTGEQRVVADSNGGKETLQ